MLNHIKKERPFSFHDEKKLSFDWMAGSEEELERKEIGEITLKKKDEA